MWSRHSSQTSAPLSRKQQRQGASMPVEDFRIESINDLPYILSLPRSDGTGQLWTLRLRLRAS